MEEKEKERDDHGDYGFEPERSDMSEVESRAEPLRADEGILGVFGKRRLEGKMEYVQSVLEGILFRMGLDARVVAEGTEGEIRLDIKGDNSGLLIGKHGRTLDALQYVVNKVCHRRFGEDERVVLDSENYRKRRVEALENLALRLGEKVKKKRRALVAGVFNSRDRRIIHMALKRDTAVETESRGEGFYKKLVIRPRVSARGEAFEDEAS
jgi:spoIIIJ-associated protein